MPDDLAAYLRALADEIDAGADLGIVIITADNDEDGATVEMASNLSETDTADILHRISQQGTIH